MNNEINFSELDADAINNLIGEAKVIPEPKEEPGIDAGMRISLDTQILKASEHSTKLENYINYEYNFKEFPEELISLSLLEGEEKEVPVINKEFVEQYFLLTETQEKLNNQINNAKEKLKSFIEEHNLGSVSSNGMDIKYSPATTTTTIDTTMLKSDFPDIAAKCSKVSARKSSISIKETN